MRLSNRQREIANSLPNFSKYYSLDGETLNKYFVDYLVDELMENNKRKLKKYELLQKCKHCEHSHSCNPMIEALENERIAEYSPLNPKNKDADGFDFDYTTMQTLNDIAKTYSRFEKAEILAQK